MPVSGDTRQALKLLERIQVHLQENEAAQLSPTVEDDLNTLMSVLTSPVFNSILTIQDSLQELKKQLHKHPSILPVDFDISPTSGELIINLPSEPILVQNSDSYEPSSDPEQNYDYDSQVVKNMANLKMDDGEPHSSEISSMIGAPPEYALSAITTESYAEEFQRTIDQGAQGREIHTLQLFKPEGSSLGFSVVGLKSDEKGELGIFIQEIQPNGIAERDGRLQEGDQILAIDGQPLDSNISHQQAISILQQARGLVELIVARGGIPASAITTAPISLERTPSDASKASDMLNTEWAQVEAIDLINDGSGLGFGIIGGRSTGVVVKTILPGGVADRDGRLQSGDHILQIGEVHLRGMGSEQVAMVLRQSGTHVRLVVARPVEFGAALRSRAPLVATRALADPDEVERHLALFPPLEPSPYKGPAAPPDAAHFAYRRELLDYGTQASYSSSDGRPREHQELVDELPEMEIFDVELVKDQQGLGITIAGYVCEKEEISGIFVKSIAKGSAADMCGQIRVNDQIIEVDGRPLHGYTNHDAVEVLRSTGKSVKLRLARYLRGAKYQQLQLAIASGELSYPSLPTVQAQIHEPKISSELSTQDLDVSDVNFHSGDDYASPLTAKQRIAIQAKWRKVVGLEFEIIVAQITKFREGGGLGISLEGTVDVEDGEEVRPHHYIRSILPEGPVGVNGILESGDELLEVNGTKLIGIDHIEVVATLKELPLHVRMVCARPLSDPPPSTSAAGHLAYDLAPRFGGSLSSLSPIGPERLVKAKSDGSLASCGAPPPHDLSKLKSRSLEPLTGLAMWSSEPQVIELLKGDRGLGFSILDYQDPMNPNETVIVIRSLVPGGVAQQDGRLIPGDRLLFVNDTNLENASLDAAVQALKGAPKGAVRIGVAKPLPLPESGQQMSLENSPTFPDMKTSFELPFLPQRLSLDLEQKKLLSPVDEIPIVASSTLEVKDQNGNKMPGVEVINICKGPHVFGLSVNIVDSGTLTVTSVTPGSACQRDGRLKPGDVLISVNGRCLVNAEAKTVGEALRSVDKSASDVVIHYLPALSSSLSTLDSLSILRRPSTKSEEYFDVPETEPPDPPINCPPPLPSEVDTPPPTYTPLEPKVLPPAESKLSPISLPAITSPKPSLGLKPLDVGSMVSKMKPTVPFKPTRVSLSPKDALPARVKSKLSLIETVLTGDRGTATRQWGPESTVELERDPVKGLGISILHANKVDNVRGGIFIKNVLPDSPAGLEGTLKRGDRILEVNGVDIRNADHAEAVSVIKTATNPVKFIIQSLVPMPKKTEQETPSLTKSPSFSSPESSPKDVLKVTDILPLTSPTLSSPVLKTQESLSRSSSNSSTFETSRTSFGEASKRSSIPSEPAGTVQSQPIVLSVASEPTSNVQSQSPFVQSVQEEEAKEAEDEVPAPLAEGKVYSRKGKQIDLDSAANIKLTPLEVVSDTESEDEFGYTTKKVQKKYGDMKGELILVHMVKGSNKLGLSLAGNKDRTKMSVFVCGMHPKGVAAKDGRIRIGDEVLEVNGVVVYGRCHLNASAMIKSLSGTAYRILLLRRDGAVDEMAVKPLSQFPSELDEEAIEDKYCHYRGMHTVTVRKGALGLGIMIIEGKHAEVGQGIFISDIQENSAAEQAGLNVGDMILAANDADLVGADYDTAATILKQAEGLLTLIVANPNKPTPGYIYEEKKDAEIPEKNMTIKTCEKKKEKRQAPIPPPKPRKSSTGMPQPLETRTLEVSVAPLPAAAVISEVANAALSPQEDSEPDPKKCDIRPARETTIEITKEKIGLGLSIVGGSDTPLGAVIIHEVYPDGAAALDGRLRPGDQILEVNGEDLRDALHEHAIAVLRQTPSVVQLVVYREDEEAAFEAMDVELNKKPGRGLGLSIVGRKNGPGVFISEVVKGGIAEADGRLIQGDQILEVNGQDLKTASQEHAAAVLKTTMGRIHMKIGRLKAGSRRSTTAPKIQENLDSSISCSPAELKTIRLERGPSGLGFSIVGGRGSPHGDLPIFVKRVFGGAAEGHLRQGDQIVSVNARPLQGLTHDEAVEVLRRVSGTVALDILS